MSESNFLQSVSPLSKVISDTLYWRSDTKNKLEEYASEVLLKDTELKNLLATLNAEEKSIMSLRETTDRIITSLKHSGDKISFTHSQVDKFLSDCHSNSPENIYDEDGFNTGKALVAEESKKICYRSCVNNRKILYGLQ